MIARWLHPRMAAAWWFAVVVAFSIPVPAYSQDIEVVKEYKVKVAYIYNFARYIRWPKDIFANADSPFVIGILGDAPFGETLQRLAESRQIHDRRIAVRHFAAPQDYKPCQILFVTASVDDEARKEIADLTAGMPVLIVGETAGFATQGAGINFYYDADDTIGFEINVDSLKRRHLNVDARLLKLARIVGDD